MYRLVQFQNENGSVLNSDPNNSRSSSYTTVTYSYGDDYIISCTSLSIMAWLRGGSNYIDKVTSAVKWLATKCSYGRFGSTHSTILALKAIVEYEAFLNTGNASLSSLKVTFDEEPNPVKIEDSKIVSNLTSKIKFGKKHKVNISHKEKNPLFFAASIKYYQEQPDNHPNCCLTLKTELKSTTINEGEGTEINVTITNTDKIQGVPMTTAIIGLPGGLEPRHKQLKDLVELGKIDFYEVMDRDVVVYLREMGPEQALEFKIDVTASFPGEYSSNASCVYLYYTHNERFWTDPLTVKIEPAQ